VSKIDLSLAGSYLDSSDDLSNLEKFLTAQDDFSASSMKAAMSALFGRIHKDLSLSEDAFNNLSNINKFYLIRGAYPEKEDELRAFILERFYRFTS
tara:strand:- start:2538 stop:2825 length:288 start_codon:yes stop_codon:yes gene_type:complete